MDELQSAHMLFGKAVWRPEVVRLNLAIAIVDHFFFFRGLVQKISQVDLGAPSF